MNVLANVDVFQDFAPEGLDRLVAHGRPRTFAAGEPLLHQGEVSGVMYVIVRGQVRKQRTHADLDEPVTILDLGPGESVGELGVLDLSASPETVIALEDTDAIELSARTLAETMLLYPVPSVGLLTSLSRSVHTLAGLEERAQQLLSLPDPTASAE